MRVFRIESVQMRAVLHDTWRLKATNVYCIATGRGRDGKSLLNLESVSSIHRLARGARHNSYSVHINCCVFDSQRCTSNLFDNIIEYSGGESAIFYFCSKAQTTVMSVRLCTFVRPPTFAAWRVYFITANSKSLLYTEEKNWRLLLPSTEQNTADLKTKDGGALGACE